MAAQAAIMQQRTTRQRAVVLIAGLCLFIFMLGFKPSEPYLSDYLICNKSTQEDYCSSFHSAGDCAVNSPCVWSGSTCIVTACADVAYASCGDDDYDYCEQDGGVCSDAHCDMHFSEDEVNNEIYPWATYAYLPFLLCLGPLAEVFSYRATILCGILGRAVTRLLLLYGKSLSSMQVMEVTYALGSAAEDVFSAYVYYVVPPDQYQTATSWIKAASIVSHVLSGILGDVLVVTQDTSLRVLMWISAAFVWVGFLLGIVLLRKPMPPSGSETPPSGSEGSTANPLHVESAHDGRERDWAAQTPTEGKIDAFRRQLHSLRSAVQSPSVGAMLILWLVGFAVFSILYSYEASIFEELAGSDDWNGSVLAVMLLTGAAGAMLPSWLGQNQNPDQGPDQDKREVSGTDSGLVVASRLLVASFCATLALVLFASAWSLVPSVAFLALFFATWQYISAVVYARLALQLRAQQAEEGSQSGVSVGTGDGAQVMATDPVGSRADSANNSQNEFTARGIVVPHEPPFSMAIVCIVATSVALQSVLQALMLSWLGLSMKAMSWVLVLIFIAATGTFCAQSVLQFGAQSLGAEWVRAALWIACRGATPPPPADRSLPADPAPRSPPEPLHLSQEL